MAGSSFGTLFRFTSWGESHGPAIGCVVDGTPPRIALSEPDIQVWLDKRRPGQSRFVTQRQEPDTVKILSGVFEGVTTGTPIALHIDNVDQRSRDYGEIKDQFRPSHADYTYFKKYGVRDYRGGGRQSARETAVRVAAGAIARKILGDAVSIRGAVIQIGSQKIDRANWNWEATADNPFWCPDRQAAQGWEGYLDDVRKRGSSCGAVVEVVASGVPVGLGDPVYDKLDADLAKALMSINAVKGRFCRGGADRRGERRRDAHHRRQPDVPHQSRRRHPGRNLDRPGHRLPPGRQADQFHPLARAQHRSLRQGDRTAHQGPPRPLRRHPRHAGGRGHGGLRAGRPSAASSRPVRLTPTGWPP